jgi:hypothetical protein
MYISHLHYYHYYRCVITSFIIFLRFHIPICISQLRLNYFYEKRIILRNCHKSTQQTFPINLVIKKIQS